MAALMEVAVPDIGDFVDVPVVEVLVAPGDTVAPEDPLVVLESDKATMEVPAPVGGVVRELRVAVGDKVSEGTALLGLEVADAATAEQATAEAAARPAGEAGAPRAVEGAIAAEVAAGPPAGEGSGGDSAGAIAAEVAAGPPAGEGSGGDSAGAIAAGPPAGAGDGAGPAAAPPGGASLYASPSVRRLARQRGIDLTAVTGTGRKGRITKDDLDRPAAAPAGAPGAPVAASPAAERVPLTRIQRLSAATLTRAWTTIPHVTHHDDADITELEAFRKQLNAEQSDVKVTMVALLLKACAAALDAFPRFASSLDGDELVVKPERHLGFAADTPGGLVVPVVHDVGAKGLLQLGAELTELSAKARAGKLGPKEMSGAVFTISSLGGIGGTGFTPIVNPPQVAILGVVRSATKPVWDGTAFVPRLVLPLSLSYDHRVIDGAAAARFTAHLAGLLSDLRRVLV
jgi:pyruvate dehydrogenase E2 component (dihydrolipoamide acetyltransferase)